MRVAKKNTDCKNCESLSERLDRLEQRLEDQESATTHWRKRWAKVDEELKVANGKISKLEAENKQLRKVIEKKDAQIQRLQKKVFAPSSEATIPEVKEPEWEEAPPKRPRGKQPGTKGFGRKIRNDLPVEEIVHDVSSDEKACCKCGLQRERIPFCEESEEIHYSYKLVRVRHKRLKYKKVCQCRSGEKAIITAETPAKLIPKGMFSTEFWTHVLLEKFLLQRPLSRICMSFKLHGLTVSEGTLTSSLKYLPKLFAPLYNAIRKRSKTGTHFQMDETHWRVFTDLMGKTNHKWWLWVLETKDTTVFTLDPSRSSTVPLRLLEGVDTGILTCDRYSAYQPLMAQGILLSYCWAHVRRDFIKLKDGYPKLCSFARKWIERIDSLFHYNKQRDVPDAERELKEICERMKRDAERLLKRKETHEEARYVLTSLLKHWDGLTLFLKHPSIPLDNNASERALRNSVVGRKNYYGSRSIWSGYLASMLFSIFSTLAKNKVDPHLYMRDYLTACAKNKGRPPNDVSSFLPWNYKTNISEPLATTVH